MISDWARRGISISSDILISDSPLADDIVDALRINLTLRLAPAFGITLNPVLVETAAETFRALGNRATSPAPDYELNTWGWLVADALQRSTVIMEGMRPSTGQVAIVAFSIFAGLPSNGRLTDC